MRRVPTESLQTWADWTSAVAQKPATTSPPAVSRRLVAAGGDANAPGPLSPINVERNARLEQLSVPGPMCRSVTVAHLQCAAGLLRDGYGTRDELSRLGALVRDAANVDMGLDHVASSISASESATDVADELVALAARYGDAEQDTDEQLEVKVASARALIDRALVPRDTGRFMDAATQQTARLLVVICRRISSGKINAAHVAILLDSAFGRVSGEEDPASAAAVVRRLESLRRRCTAKKQGGALALAATNSKQHRGASSSSFSTTNTTPTSLDEDSLPLRRGDMLQLKHVVHSIVTLHLDVEATEAKDEPNGASNLWSHLSRKSSLLFSSNNNSDDDDDDDDDKKKNKKKNKNNNDNNNNNENKTNGNTAEAATTSNKISWWLFGGGGDGGRNAKSTVAASSPASGPPRSPHAGDVNSSWSSSLMAADQLGKPRNFKAPMDRSGVGRWSRAADALAAYEGASERRRGVRLSESPRIWCVSDVHVDAACNAAWLHDLEARPEDTLIVAGDVASTLEAIGKALGALRAKYRHVFFVPGNHELWVMFDVDPANEARRKDSVQKFFNILKLCDELGVHTGPAFVGDVLVVPLFSWYKRARNQPAPADAGGCCGGGQQQRGADGATPTTRAPPTTTITTTTTGTVDAGLLEYFDSACVWPWKGCTSSLDDAVADFFLALNYGTLEWVERHRGSAPVVSFSHFVPRVPDLFPGFVAFRHVMGCQELDAQIDRLRPRVHCFGHSHINVDEIIGGTRYIQQALGHPSDGLSDASGAFGPLLVWTTGSPSVLDDLSRSAVRRPVPTADPTASPNHGRANGARGISHPPSHRPSGHHRPGTTASSRGPPPP